jgi:serine/threonine protein kinase
LLALWSKGKVVLSKADIWSIGAVFFNMVFGKPPYDSKKAERMYNEIKSKKILDTEEFTYNNYTASKEVTSFLKQVLVVDPKDRLDWK